MISGKYKVVTIDEAILQAKGGTTAAPIGTWRDRMSADLVMGFTPYKTAVHSNTCGLAYLAGAYGQGVNGVANAANTGYAFIGEGVDTTSGKRCLENVLPHEIGHLMGADHDRITVGSSYYNEAPFSYGFGYRSRYGGTIMAYAYPRFNIFSSPAVMKCGGTGVVCGTATEDNARVLRETKTAVANYRLGYNDPAVKISGTVSYYGAGLPSIQVVNSSRSCNALTASNGYFSCSLPMNSTGSVTTVTGNIITPTSSVSTDATTGVTTRTMYKLAPISGSNTVSYSNLTQTTATALNFNLNLGLKKVVSTCVTNATTREQSCTVADTWVKAPVSVVSNSVNTVINAGTTPLPSPAVK